VDEVDGTPFGRYRLVELLGRGGMGEVWRAHDKETDRVVAIKVLPANFSENEDFQRRFRREAHSAALLDSPHVIPIHNYGEIDGRLYVDMRLIKGRDLQAVLADGPLPPARAVRIIEQVAEALHAAHEVGLLHRDVKPSNILLDKNDFAYLIDFGIARAADETRLTKSGNAIGTFQYIAPERLGTRREEDTGPPRVVARSVAQTHRRLGGAAGPLRHKQRCRRRYGLGRAAQARMPERSERMKR
jgi:serine/threonine-protein kinase